MSNKIYISDVGTVISVDVGTSVSGATDATLEVSKPDGTTVSWSATTAGTALSVIIVDGDFDVSGSYLLQAKLTINGWTGRGETAKFTVYKNFE